MIPFLVNGMVVCSQGTGLFARWEVLVGTPAVEEGDQGDQKFRPVACDTNGTYPIITAGGSVYTTSIMAVETVPIVARCVADSDSFERSGWLRNLCIQKL